MESTEKTAVQEIAPGVYRVVEVGGHGGARSAITGPYVTGATATRHPRSTTSDAVDAATNSTGRRTTTTKSAINGRFITKSTSVKKAR